MRPTLWLLALVITTAVPASGQANPDRVHRRNECRRALQIVQTGHPASQRDWAYGYVRLCGPEAGRVLAEVIRTSRRGSDPTTLERVTRPTLYLIDRSIFEAAAEVAQDRSASVAARVLALRALVAVALPNATPSYAEMTGAAPLGAPCIGGYSTHDVTEAGAPLPTNVYQRSYTLANSIARNTSEAEPIREAARCVTWLAGKRLGDAARP